MEPFLEKLRGDKNELGRTEEVVAAVLADPERICRAGWCRVWWSAATAA